MARIEEQLRKRGFTQDRKAPNIFRKNGVAITLDQVNHEGLKETLAKHAAALR